MDISQLIFLVYSRKATPEQQRQLDEWLREDPRNRELYDYITNPHRIASITAVPEPVFSEDRALAALRQRFARRRRRRVIGYAAACAVLAVGVAIGSMFFTGNPRPDNPQTARTEISIAPVSSKSKVHYGEAKEKNLDSGEYDNSELFAGHEAAVEKATVSVANGGFIQLTLDDGTRVWLNSDTEFTFPGRFTGSERTVTLGRGEAYLEVAHDPARPFIVNYGDGESVRVLGTKFNIQNYTDEPSVVATLVEGSISLSGMSVPMRPGEQTTINKDDGHTETRTVDPRDYIAWINHQYVFKSASLEQIARQMARWYDVSFSFEDDSLRKVTFTGTLHKSQDGGQILDILASTGRASFRQEGNVITVSKP